MANSKTIAALLGPSLIAGALSIFFNLGAWPEIVDDAAQNPALLWVSGWPVFVAGLAIVYLHNQWTGGWPILVTVLGWLAVVSGLVRILFPVKIAGIGLAVGAAHTAGVLPIVGIIILLVGAFLSFKPISASKLSLFRSWLQLFLPHYGPLVRYGIIALTSGLGSRLRTCSVDDVPLAEPNPGHDIGRKSAHRRDHHVVRHGSELEHACQGKQIKPPLVINDLLGNRLRAADHDKSALD
jgi:hypothetical protein